MKEYLQTLLSIDRLIRFIDNYRDMTSNSLFFHSQIDQRQTLVTNLDKQTQMAIDQNFISFHIQIWTKIFAINGLNQELSQHLNPNEMLFFN